MEGDVAGAGIDRGCAEAAIVDRGITGGDLAAIAADRDEGRDPVVLGRDHAADGLRAVAQSGRPADHLDPIVDERIDGNGVILAEVRDVLHADAVLLDAHARVVQAADDRARCGTRSEGRGRETRLVEQQVAQLAWLLADDLAAVDHGDRGEGAGDDRQHAVGGAGARGGRRASRLDRARGGDGDLVEPDILSLHRSRGEEDRRQRGAERQHAQAGGVRHRDPTGTL